MQTTGGGARGTLPLTFLKVLASQACHGRETVLFFHSWFGLVFLFFFNLSCILPGAVVSECVCRNSSITDNVFHRDVEVMVFLWTAPWGTSNTALIYSCMGVTYLPTLTWNTEYSSKMHSFVWALNHWNYIYVKEQREVLQSAWKQAGKNT